MFRTRTSNSRQPSAPYGSVPVLSPANPSSSTAQRPTTSGPWHARSGDLSHPRHSNLGLKRSSDVPSTCAPATRTTWPSHTQFVKSPVMHILSSLRRSPCLALTLHNPLANIRAPHLRDLELLCILFPRQLFPCVCVPTDNVNNERSQGRQRLFRPRFCNCTRQMNLVSGPDQAQKQIGVKTHASVSTHYVSHEI